MRIESKEMSTPSDRYRDLVIVAPPPTLLPTKKRSRSTTVRFQPLLRPSVPPIAGGGGCRAHRLGLLVPAPRQSRIRCDSFDAQLLECRRVIGFCKSQGRRRLTRLRSELEHRPRRTDISAGHQLLAPLDEQSDFGRFEASLRGLDWYDRRRSRLG